MQGIQKHRNKSRTNPAQIGSATHFRQGKRSPNIKLHLYTLLFLLLYLVQGIHQSLLLRTISTTSHFSIEFLIDWHKLRNVFSAQRLCRLRLRHFVLRIENRAKAAQSGQRRQRRQVQLIRLPQDWLAAKPWQASEAQQTESVCLPHVVHWNLLKSFGTHTHTHTHTPAVLPNKPWGRT